MVREFCNIRVKMRRHIREGGSKIWGEDSEGGGLERERVFSWMLTRYDQFPTQSFLPRVCPTRKQTNSIMCLSAQPYSHLNLYGSRLNYKREYLRDSQNMQASNIQSKQEHSNSQEEAELSSYWNSYTPPSLYQQILKMVAPVTKFSFTATLVCVAMLWHGSLQMPTQARMKRDSLCDSPDVERDLLLGLRVMYRGGIFNNARSVSSKYIILYNYNTVQ